MARHLEGRTVESGFQAPEAVTSDPVLGMALLHPPGHDIRVAHRPARCHRVSNAVVLFS